MRKGGECLSSSYFFIYVKLPWSNQLFFSATTSGLVFGMLGGVLQGKGSVMLGVLDLACGSLLFALKRCKVILRFLLTYFLLC